MAARDGPEEHRGYEEMAVAHVLGGLDPSSSRSFRAHLLECGDCRARVGELRAIAHDLAGVERDERRVRAAQTIDTKAREAEDDDLEVVDEPGRWWRSRLVVFAAAAAFLALGAYTFTLRAGNLDLQRAYDERLQASAALEHGEPVTIVYQQPEVNATAKVHNGQVVLLMEGLDDEAVYGLYLTATEESQRTTIDRDIRRPENGTIFVLATLEGTEDELFVTLPDGPPGAEPDDGVQLRTTLEPAGSTP